MTATEERVLDATARLTAVVDEQAVARPLRTAFTFLPDGEIEGSALTYASLAEAARAIGAFVDSLVLPGTPVPLLYAPGLEFVTAFLGVVAYSGALAAPLYPPLAHTGGAAALAPVLDLLDPSLVLTGPGLAEPLRAALGRTAAYAETTADGRCSGGDGVPDRPRDAVDPDAAYVQFTSGSTGNPKGVVVGQRGLLRNLAVIRDRFGITEDSVGVHWLPPYHDMGLVGAILATVDSGATSVLMPPGAFVERPVRWLRAISRYGGTIAGGPDFAYRLLVSRTTEAERAGLDLGSWDVAFDGAERVRGETLRAFAETFAPYGFRAESLYPCYGLAEATLYVSGRRGLRESAYGVSCGRVSDVEGTLALQDGEIRLAGPSLALGYWHDGGEGGPSFDGGGLRTGDLGIVADGELYVVGRCKDVVVVRGRNYAAEDVEAVAADAHPALRRGRLAVVAWDDGGGESFAVVAEVRESALGDAAAVAAAIRTAVAGGLGVAPARVVVVPPGAVPTTASGKLRRSATRAELLAGRIDVLRDWPSGTAPAPDVAVDDSWTAYVVARVSALAERSVPPDSPLADAGLDSLGVAELSAVLSDVVGCDVPVPVIWAQPDVAALARYTDALRAVTRLTASERTLLAGHLDGAGGDVEVSSAWRIADLPELRDLRDRLALLDAAGLPNPFHVVQHTPTAARTVVGGRELVTFSSNDYLGMLREPSVREAAKAAVDTYGTSAFASRVVSGDRPVHRDLERELADFLGVDDALVFVSANSANVSTVARLLGPGDLAVFDERSHDSLVRGVEQARATAAPFRHNDPADAERILAARRGRHRRALVFVEGLYSMDGDVPDLAAFVALRERYRALLMVDECLSIGVLGATGRGVGEHAGIARDDVDVWMGGISKALASCGGYVAGSRDLVDLLRYGAASYVYSTGIPPANAAAALAALRVLRADPARPVALRARAAWFRDLLRERGADTGTSAGHLVVPVVVGDALTCLRLYDFLLRHGVSAQPVLHPAVPEDAPRLRFFVTTAHTDDDLLRTADVVGDGLSAQQIA